jgi:hypothetical protein
MSADFAARSLALAARRSPSTRALVDAIRSYGFYPQPLTRCPPSDVPALTLGGAGAASALNGRAAGTPLLLLSDPKLKWLAGPATQDGAGCWHPRGAWYGAGRTSQYSSFEFVHTGTELELCFTGSFATATNNLRVLVNDRTAALTNAPAGTGSFHYLRLTFPVSAVRRIRIEGAFGRFRGVNVTNANEIAATGRAYPYISVMGDSFPEATGADPMMDGEGAALVRALGGNLILGAVGGTGLLNPGTGGRVAWTDATRLTDLTMSGVSDVFGNSVTPTLGIVMASINDTGAPSSMWNGAANYETAIAKAAFTVIDAWLAANPGKPLVWFGPTAVTGQVPLDLYRMRDAVRDACWAYQSSNVWFIDRVDAVPLLRSGVRSYTTTTGTTANGSAALTGLASTANVVAGSGVVGAGIPGGARVLTVDSATQVTLSNAATASASGVSLTFKHDHAAHYTNVQATDFTHPDLRGHTLDALWMAAQLRRLILTEFA